MSRKFWNRFSWHQTPFTAICVSQKNRHKRKKRVKTWKRRRRPTTALRRPHACFFPTFPKAIWALLLNETHEKWINRKYFAARSESEVVTKSICITHAAIKTGSSNYHTEIFLVQIIFKSEEQMMINKQNPRLTLQQEWPEKITEKLTTTPGIISDTKRLGMQWCHISFEQKSTTGSILGSSFRLKIIEVVISAISTIYYSLPKNISWY